MRHATCYEVQPLLAATAAGALDSDEEQAVRDHLALCPPCVKQLHDFESAVEALAFAVPQHAPPPALRVRVMQAVVVTPQAPPPPPPVASAPRDGRPAAARPRPARRWGDMYTQLAPVALAACVVLLVGSGIWLGLMANRVATLDRSVAQQSAVRNLLEMPDAKMTTLSPTAPGGQATGQLIMAPGHDEVAVLATHLPPPQAGRAYALWLVGRNGGPPVHAADLAVDPSGVVMNVVVLTTDPAQMDGVRITDEPVAAAASSQPAGTTVLEGWYH